MKPIPLSEAHELLENCSAVEVVNDHVVLYPGVNDLTGEPDNEFAYLSWSDGGQDFYVKFTEGANQKVMVNLEDHMILVGSEGEKVEIAILEKRPI